MLWGPWRGAWPCSRVGGGREAWPSETGPSGAFAEEAVREGGRGRGRGGAKKGEEGKTARHTSIYIYMYKTPVHSNLTTALLNTLPKQHCH